jgi:hypothetical protein
LKEPYKFTKGAFHHLINSRFGSGSLGKSVACALKLDRAHWLQQNESISGANNNSLTKDLKNSQQPFWESPFEK